MTNAALAVLFVCALYSPVQPPTYHSIVASTATPLPVSGLATYYADGVMERVVVNRTAWGQLPECPECQGYVAMLQPGDLGRTVCVEIDGKTHGPYQVADVAAVHHRAGLVAKGWVLDADYQLWVAWGLPRRPSTVTVKECEP